MATKRGGKRRSKPTKPTPDGILITVTSANGDGDQELAIQTLGKVKQTELPGLLGVARNLVEAQLGIGRG